MIKHFHRLTGIKSVAIALGTAVLFSASAQNQYDSERIDSLERSMERLEPKVLSTLMSRASSPIQFSGELRSIMQFHNFTVTPDFLEQDRSYLASNWGSSDNLIRLTMQVNPNRHTELYSTLAFNHSLTGNSFGQRSGDGFRPAHSGAIQGLDLYEGLNAGMNVSTPWANFELEMGAVHWTEASPLTIWKIPSRPSAWDWLIYEQEMPISRYYEYTMATGQGEGRTAWNKKAFSGINFSSNNLPGNFDFNFVYGAFESFDNIEPEKLDLTGALGYSGDFPEETKGKGIGDSYRRVLHTRLAAQRLVGDFTPAFNFYRLRVRDDIIHAYTHYEDPEWGGDPANVLKSHFGVGQSKRDGSVIDRGFYKETNVFSVDVRRQRGDNIDIHMDLGLSMVDTNWMIFDVEGDGEFSKKEVSSSSPGFALYAMIDNDRFLPLVAELIFVTEDFYSPHSFANPIDGFFPFGANFADPGKFISDGYARNMAGAQLTYAPELRGFGHLRFKYGQHFQLQPGRDLIYFPYRLNGRDFNSINRTSYNLYGDGLLDFSLSNNYTSRLGDQSFQEMSYSKNNGEGALHPAGPFAGGIRADYLSAFEAFAAYDNELQARANNHDHNQREYLCLEEEVTVTIPVFAEDGSVTGDDTTLTSSSSFIPVNRKFTFNFETEFGYDISQIVGYNNALYINGHAAINGVSRSFMPLAFSDEAEDMLLWGLYLRFEPAIALRDNFYVVGIAGYENWRSQKAWMELGGRAIQVPINKTDIAFGAGFDWDIVPRVGLHCRFKWMRHTDKLTDEAKILHSSNSWQTPILTAEVKAWF
ncbi:hypothetical protein CHISP_0849 [Chitinispirillum alkaliphilum]|nr:hypothetical protein CHISP_0849 [Chitinispirillum alkaliphilum]